MTWLTWRQLRAQALVAMAALAGLAIALAVTIPRQAACNTASGTCSALTTEFVRRNQFLYDLGGYVVIAVPAIIGIFWGAPLIARELEAGTHRLAWNQSVTRTRWLASKLGLTGAAAMTTAGLLSLMVTWWASPIDRVAGNRFTPAVFDQRGIVPVGYAAFAFALGVTAGMLIRRAVPAMAATLAIFAAAQIAMPLWVRPHLIPPARVTSPLSPASLAINDLSVPTGRMTVYLPLPHLPGAWILSSPQTITTAARVASRACLRGSQQACVASLARLHLQRMVTYQPASRYWAFQWYETAIFLTLAVTMAGLCFWWIRRRPS